MARPVVLLSLDGLSAEQFAEMLASCGGEGRFSGSTIGVESRALTDTQGLWAELLTGTPWQQNGVPSFGRPRLAIGDMQACDEDDLSAPAMLLAAYPTQVLVNVPLVKPRAAQGSRYWLSDGSLPYVFSVSPPNLANAEPFSTYRGRTFPSFTNVLGERLPAAEKLIDADLVRIECARHLIKKSFDIAVIRLSIFDALAHVFGSAAAALELPKLVQPAQRLLAATAALIEEAKSKADLHIVSLFSHEPCVARFDLGRWLISEGFGSLSEASETHSMRRQAAVAVAAAHGKRVDGSLMVASTRKWHPNTQAGAPAAGCIYLNTRGRYPDGVVDQTSYAPLLDNIETRLRCFVGDELGSDVMIERGTEEQGPDLMVRIPGIEFCCTGDRVVDRLNKPRSCHSPVGFFQPERGLQVAGPLQAWQVAGLITT